MSRLNDSRGQEEGKKTMMNNDVTFLRKHLDKLQQDHLTLDATVDVDVQPETSADNEETARLADAYGLDGNVFRQVHTGRPSVTGLVSNMKEQIKMILQVIAAIEQAGEARHRVHPDTEMLSVKDLAVVLNIGESTVRQMNSKGLLPKTIRLDGSVRWDREELVAWKDAGCPPRETWE